MVRGLVGMGVEVLARDRQGKTAGDVAREMGHVGVVGVLEGVVRGRGR